MQAIQERLRMGENPRDLKLHLAEIVTALYHGHAATMDAKSYFEAAFQKKVIPTNIPTLLLEIDKERIEDIIPQLISIHFIQSKSDFLRLIKQNGVSLNGEKMAADDLSRVLMNEDVLQIGKKRFLKLNK